MSERKLKKRNRKTTHHRMENQGEDRGYDVRSLRAGGWVGLPRRELDRISASHERSTGKACDLSREREFGVWASRASSAHPIEKEILSAEAEAFQCLDEIAINWAADASDPEAQSSPHLRLRTLRGKVETVSKLSPTRAVGWFERAIERAQKEYPPFLVRHRSALEDIRSSVMERVISKAIVCEDEDDGVVVVMCPLLGNLSDYTSDDPDEEDGDYEEEEDDDE